MKMNYNNYNFLFIFSLLFSSTLAALDDTSVLDFYSQLSSVGMVDLTHAFNENIPHFGGFSPMTKRNKYNYSPDGFFVEEFCHVGQWGTHMDPPSHFHQGMRTVEEITLKELFLKLVVIDVSDKVAADADYLLQLSDVQDWESRNGMIPEGSFVAMRSDWSKRWPSDDDMKNRDTDGVFHYPGWSQESLTFLYETRKIAASGHEPTDTDGGLKVSAGNFSCESYILGVDHYQIELMASMASVPEKGALVLVSVPKISQGSGFPTRVIAFLPQTQNQTLLWALHDTIIQKDFIDLTHAFDNNTPHFKGFDPMNRTILYDYPTGFKAELFCHVGQWGTHVDPPAHFIQGLRFLDGITPQEMILPLIVLDVSAKVTQNHDYQVQMEDVRKWEEKYGMLIPSKSFALLKTDWADRWPNNSAMYNLDVNGTAHYPGWSQEVLTYLFETRNITACGHETTDTDRGLSTSLNQFPLETYILNTNHYQIELMASSKGVPEYGAVALISFPKPEHGSGFPARAFAIIPSTPPSPSSSPSPTPTNLPNEDSAGTSLVASLVLLIVVGLLAM